MLPTSNRFPNIDVTLESNPMVSISLSNGMRQISSQNFAHISINTAPTRFRYHSSVKRMMLSRVITALCTLLYSRYFAINMLLSQVLYIHVWFHGD